MVYYFTSAIVKPSAYVYVGKDKFESQSTLLLLTTVKKLTVMTLQMRNSSSTAGKRMSGKLVTLHIPYVCRHTHMSPGYEIRTVLLL